VQVPDGFPGWTLPVPRPDPTSGPNGQLYVKLRDDPSVVNLVTLTAQIEGGAKETTQKTQYRPAYVSPNEGESAAPSAGAVMPETNTPATTTPASPAAPASPAGAPEVKSAPVPGTAPAVPNAATPTTGPATPPSAKSPATVAAPDAMKASATGKAAVTGKSQPSAGKNAAGKPAAAVLQPVDPGSLI
jgi:hypothetical protein